MKITVSTKLPSFCVYQLIYRKYRSLMTILNSNIKLNGKIQTDKLYQTNGKNSSK